MSTPAGCRTLTGKTAECVWAGAGSPSTIGNLQVIRRRLEALSERGDVELLLIGARDFGLPDVPYKGVEWRGDRSRGFAAIGCGPGPSASHPLDASQVLSQAHSVYGARNTACGHTLGSNPFVIEEGRTGFLASDDEEPGDEPWSDWSTPRAS